MLQYISDIQDKTTSYNIKYLNCFLSYICQIGGDLTYPFDTALTNHWTHYGDVKLFSSLPQFKTSIRWH